MAQDIKLIVYPAKDLAASKALLSTFLGVEPYADAPYYVGYKAGNLEIGLDPNGQEVIIYSEVNDIKASLDTLVSAGGAIDQEPTDVGGGMLIAKVKDANGNVIGLRQLPAKTA